MIESHQKMIAAEAVSKPRASKTRHISHVTTRLQKPSAPKPKAKNQEPPITELSLVNDGKTEHKEEIRGLSVRYVAKAGFKHKLRERLIKDKETLEEDCQLRSAIVTSNDQSSKKKTVSFSTDHDYVLISPASTPVSRCEDEGADEVFENYIENIQKKPDIASQSQTSETLVEKPLDVEFLSEGAAEEITHTRGMYSLKKVIKNASQFSPISVVVKPGQQTQTVEYKLPFVKDHSIASDADELYTETSKSELRHAVAKHEELMPVAATVRPQLLKHRDSGTDVMHVEKCDMSTMKEEESVSAEVQTEFTEQRTYIQTYKPSHVMQGVQTQDFKQTEITQTDWDHPLLKEIPTQTQNSLKSHADAQTSLGLSIIKKASQNELSVVDTSKLSTLTMADMYQMPKLERDNENLHRVSTGLQTVQGLKDINIQTFFSDSTQSQPTQTVKVMVTESQTSSQNQSAFTQTKSVRKVMAVMPTQTDKTVSTAESQTQTISLRVSSTQTDKTAPVVKTKQASTINVEKNSKRMLNPEKSQEIAFDATEKRLKIEDQPIQSVSKEPVVSTKRSVSPQKICRSLPVTTSEDNDFTIYKSLSQSSVQVASTSQQTDKKSASAQTQTQAMKQKVHYVSSQTTFKPSVETKPTQTETATRLVTQSRTSFRKKNIYTQTSAFTQKNRAKDSQTEETTDKKYIQTDATLQRVTSTQTDTSSDTSDRIEVIVGNEKISQSTTDKYGNIIAKNRICETKIKASRPTDDNAIKFTSIEPEAKTQERQVIVKKATKRRWNPQARKFDEIVVEEIASQISGEKRVTTDLQATSEPVEKQINRNTIQAKSTLPETQIVNTKDGDKSSLITAAQQSSIVSEDKIQIKLKTNDKQVTSKVDKKEKEVKEKAKATAKDILVEKMKSELALDSTISNRKTADKSTKVISEAKATEVKIKSCNIIADAHQFVFDEPIINTQKEQVKSVTKRKWNPRTRKFDETVMKVNIHQVSENEEDVAKVDSNKQNFELMKPKDKLIFTDVTLKPLDLSDKEFQAITLEQSVDQKVIGTFEKDEQQTKDKAKVTAKKAIVKTVKTDVAPDGTDVIGTTVVKSGTVISKEKVVKTKMKPCKLTHNEDDRISDEPVANNTEKQFQKVTKRKWNPKTRKFEEIFIEENIQQTSKDKKAVSEAQAECNTKVTDSALADRKSSTTKTLMETAFSENKVQATVTKRTEVEKVTSKLQKNPNTTAKKIMAESINSEITRKNAVEKMADEQEMVAVKEKITETKMTQNKSRVDKDNVVSGEALEKTQEKLVKKVTKQKWNPKTREFGETAVEETVCQTPKVKEIVTKTQTVSDAQNTNLFKVDSKVILPIVSHKPLVTSEDVIQATVLEKVMGKKEKDQQQSKEKSKIAAKKIIVETMKSELASDDTESKSPLAVESGKAVSEIEITETKMKSSTPTNQEKLAFDNVIMPIEEKEVNKITKRKWNLKAKKFNEIAFEKTADQKSKDTDTVLKIEIDSVRPDMESIDADSQSTLFTAIQHSPGASKDEIQEIVLKRKIDKQSTDEFHKDDQKTAQKAKIHAKENIVENVQSELTSGAAKSTARVGILSSNISEKEMAELKMETKKSNAEVVEFALDKPAVNVEEKQVKKVTKQKWNPKTRKFDEVAVKEIIELAATDIKKVHAISKAADKRFDNMKANTVKVEGITPSGIEKTKKIPEESMKAIPEENVIEGKVKTSLPTADQFAFDKPVARIEDKHVKKVTKRKWNPKTKKFDKVVDETIYQTLINKDAISESSTPKSTSIPEVKPLNDETSQITSDVEGLKFVKAENKPTVTTVTQQPLVTSKDEIQATVSEKTVDKPIIDQICIEESQTKEQTNILAKEIIVGNTKSELAISESKATDNTVRKSTKIMLEETISEYKMEPKTSVADKNSLASDEPVTRIEEPHVKRLTKRKWNPKTRKFDEIVVEGTIEQASKVKNIDTKLRTTPKDVSKQRNQVETDAQNIACVEVESKLVISKIKPKVAVSSENEIQATILKKSIPITNEIHKDGQQAKEQAKILAKEIIVDSLKSDLDGKPKAASKKERKTTEIISEEVIPECKMDPKITSIDVDKFSFDEPVVKIREEAKKMTRRKWNPKTKKFDEIVIDENIHQMPKDKEAFAELSSAPKSTSMPEEKPRDDKIANANSDDQSTKFVKAEDKPTFTTVTQQPSDTSEKETQATLSKRRVDILVTDKIYKQEHQTKKQAKVLTKEMVAENKKSVLAFDELKAADKRARYSAKLVSEETVAEYKKEPKKTVLDVDSFVSDKRMVEIEEKPVKKMTKRKWNPKTKKFDEVVVEETIDQTSKDKIVVTKVQLDAERKHTEPVNKNDKSMSTITKASSISVDSTIKTTVTKQAMDDQIESKLPLGKQQTKQDTKIAAKETMKSELASTREQKTISRIADKSSKIVFEEKVTETEMIIKKPVSNTDEFTSDKNVLMTDEKQIEETSTKAEKQQPEFSETSTKTKRVWNPKSRKFDLVVNSPIEAIKTAKVSSETKVVTEQNLPKDEVKQSAKICKETDFFTRPSSPVVHAKLVETPKIEESNFFQNKKELENQIGFNEHELLSSRNKDVASKASKKETKPGLKELLFENKTPDRVKRKQPANLIDYKVATVKSPESLIMHDEVVRTPTLEEVKSVGTSKHADEQTDNELTLFTSKKSITKQEKSKEKASGDGRFSESKKLETSLLISESNSRPSSPIIYTETVMIPTVEPTKLFYSEKQESKPDDKNDKIKVKEDSQQFKPISATTAHLEKDIDYQNIKAQRSASPIIHAEGIQTSTFEKVKIVKNLKQASKEIEQSDISADNQKCQHFSPVATKFRKPKEIEHLAESKTTFEKSSVFDKDAETPTVTKPGKLIGFTDVSFVRPSSPVVHAVVVRKPTKEKVNVDDNLSHAKEDVSQSTEVIIVDKKHKQITGAGTSNIPAKLISEASAQPPSQIIFAEVVKTPAVKDTTIFNKKASASEQKDINSKKKSKQSKVLEDKIPETNQKIVTGEVITLPSLSTRVDDKHLEIQEFVTTVPKAKPSDDILQKEKKYASSVKVTSKEQIPIKVEHSIKETFVATADIQDQKSIEEPNEDLHVQSKKVDKHKYPTLDKSANFKEKIFVHSPNPENVIEADTLIKTPFIKEIDPFVDVSVDAASDYEVKSQVAPEISKASKSIAATKKETKIVKRVWNPITKQFDEVIIESTKEKQGHSDRKLKPELKTVEVQKTKQQMEEKKPHLSAFSAETTNIHANDMQKSSSNKATTKPETKVYKKVNEVSTTKKVKMVWNPRTRKFDETVSEEIVSEKSEKKLSDSSNEIFDGAKLKLPTKANFRNTAKESGIQEARSPTISETTYTLFKRDSFKEDVEMPVFLKSICSVEVEAGKPALFYCQIDGKPVPKITWFVEDVTIEPPCRGFTVIDDDETKTYSLVMETPTLNNDGKMIRCVLRNTAGTAESTATLNVRAGIVMCIAS